MTELITTVQDFMTGPYGTYVIYAGTFLGVLLLYTGLSSFLSRREMRSEALSRRMRLIDKGATTPELLALLKPDTKHGLLNRLPFVGDLPVTMLQAGIFMSPKTFMMICVTIFVCVLAIFAAITAPSPAVAIAFVVGFVLPITIVRNKRTTRINALISQLPDSLDLIARGLRVGHPLNTSVKAVAEEMADPIGSEFGIIFDQVSYGDDLPDAFAEFAERIDVEDVHYLSASIGIQHGTGGDLARVISILANVIRDRIAMRRRIRAITSEGRLTGIFLSVLPVAILGFTHISTPSYFGGVADDPMFNPMMMAIATFILLNFIVLRRLVNFRL